MKALYFILGCISLVVGAIGVVLPILPTTPLLLLAAFCFAKSSKKLHTWLLGTKLYQKHLEDFVNSRSMTLESKVKILALASSMLLLAFLMVDVIYARITIAIVFVFKYYYFIFKIKTIRKEVPSYDDK